jgi:glycosyltransferase involved in cell wall biosynthesis
MRLIAAFDGLRQRGRREHLVLVGQLGWQYRPLLREVEKRGLSDCVRFLGYVPSEDLPPIYGAATALAFPSLYEGFGLPIVEAMACETPVLTSKFSATAEIGGDAALLVDPLSIEEIEAGLFSLLTDDSLRQQLREKGAERSSQFSWNRAAEETAALYREIEPRLCQ